MNTHKDFFHFVSHTPNPFLKMGRIIYPKPMIEEKKRERHIRKIQYQKNQLIVLNNPGKKDILYLKKKYNFHPIHLEDVSSTLQRPKIDIEENYIFLVLHFPHFNHETHKIESNELDLFLTKNDVIAVKHHPFLPFDEMVKNLCNKKKERVEFFEKGAGFLLYRLIDNLVDSIFPLLDQIDKGLELIDKEVYTKSPKNVVENLSFLRRNVIVFQTFIRPEMNAFLTINEIHHPLMDKELKTYFTNITDHLKKIWDRLEDINELSDNLSSNFESYVSYKTNETIKVLTVFSVILLPLTLLSGIYGMNLANLPLADHPLAIFIIGLFMFSIVTSMLIFFKIKNWI